mgnify:CR=1 FL=1
MKLGNFHGIPLLENEEFKEVIGYEGRYHISNIGRLISLKGNPKILKLTIDSKGYYGINGIKNGRHK